MLAADVRDLVEALRGEVRNGGFEQYFTNSSGDDVHEVLAALDRIGADITARIVRRACAKFPTGHPARDADERRDQLDQLYRRGMFAVEDRDFYRRDDDLDALVRAYEIAEDEAILGGPGIEDTSSDIRER